VGAKLAATPMNGDPINSVPRPTCHPIDTLLDVARDLVVRDGARAVTVDRIIEISGAPKGSIYHRFSTVDDLLAAMWIRAVRRSQVAFLAELANMADRAHPIPARHRFINVHRHQARQRRNVAADPPNPRRLQGHSLSVGSLAHSVTVTNGGHGGGLAAPPGIGRGCRCSLTAQSRAGRRGGVVDAWASVAAHPPQLPAELSLAGRRALQAAPMARTYYVTVTQSTLCYCNAEHFAAMPVEALPHDDETGCCRDCGLGTSIFA
jgi:AcrR family transcriptional regulator